MSDIKSDAAILAATSVLAPSSRDSMPRIERCDWLMVWPDGNPWNGVFECGAVDNPPASDVWIASEAEVPAGVQIWRQRSWPADDEGCDNSCGRHCNSYHRFPTIWVARTAAEAFIAESARQGELDSAGEKGVRRFLMPLGEGVDSWTPTLRYSSYEYMTAGGRELVAPDLGNDRAISFAAYEVCKLFATRRADPPRATEVAKEFLHALGRFRHEAETTPTPTTASVKPPQSPEKKSQHVLNMQAARDVYRMDQRTGTKRSRRKQIELMRAHGGKGQDKVLIAALKAVEDDPDAAGA